MTDDIVHEATYPHPPAAVWRTITTPDAMGAWLMRTTFREPTVGHRFQYRDKPRPGWSGVTDCEVLEVVPERRLVFSFGAPEDSPRATRVTFELEPVANGTRVRFRHEGFVGLKGWMMRQGMNNGWGKILKHAIPFVLDEMTRTGRVPPRDEVQAVKRSGARAAHVQGKARG